MYDYYINGAKEMNGCKLPQTENLHYLGLNASLNQAQWQNWYAHKTSAACAGT